MSTSCDQKIMRDGVCEKVIDAVSNDINNMDISNNNNIRSAGDADSISVCANCGKEGSNNDMNTCNKCKIAKYCNASCKKKHRHKHKKECEEHVRLATERAAELHDKNLFKEPPPLEDCPICFLLLPSFHTGRTYMSCCGKRICSGCCFAPVYDNQGNKVKKKKCPFCRTPYPKTNEEAIERHKKRLELGDSKAMHSIGCYYSEGMYGLPQDYDKALELWHRAGELGCTEAYCSIGYAYVRGEGVEVDKRKAIHYWELGAIGGNEVARHNLGAHEAHEGNMERALKHHMIAVRGGYSKSLKQINRLYSNGHATKEDYMEALRIYQTYLGEIKSTQRDKAAARDNEEYRYF